MSTPVPVQKDPDNEQPVPSAWRPMLAAVVATLARGDWQLATGVPGVAPVPAATAAQMRDAVADYGATLVELPEAAWDSAVCLWEGHQWNVIVDLWTAGEGRSDLVLQAFVTEAGEGVLCELHMVYVP